eukprot:CAMPEP_0169384058 /NCGR_PEP_ID=MMETSP1017-20121227/43186_1 /TAXON_ID=342587 /ORGANISM="Karlodinium micrum, Strain CCMP2283" /LENGTH=122 /DNA_ID=CAMNT_0009484513 /DNA_START=262 /DNA_END=630 /DNA_ORIENTATION=-
MTARMDTSRSVAIAPPNGRVANWSKAMQQSLLVSSHKRKSHTRKSLLLVLWVLPGASSIPVGLSKRVKALEIDIKLPRIEIYNVTCSVVSKSFARKTTAYVWTKAETTASIAASANLESMRS